MESEAAVAAQGAPAAASAAHDVPQGLGAYRDTVLVAEATGGGWDLYERLGYVEIQDDEKGRMVLELA